MYRLPNFADVEGIRTSLASTKSKDAANLVASAKNVWAIPPSALDLFAEYVEKNAATTDRQALGAMRRICIWLGESGNGKYLDSLARLKQHPDPGARGEAILATLKIHIAGGNVAAIYPDLESSDPVMVRIAARVIYSKRLYDAATLQRLLASIRKNASSSDPVMLNALAIMVKTIGQSGEDSYREPLNAIAASTASERLRKQATAAIQLLDREIETEESE